MSQRLKLIIAYDGAQFAGWQSQSHRNTVQDHLERAFRQIEGKPVRLHGAGRTDAGVHALGQCAHVDVNNRKLTPARWLGALNAQLPPQLRVLRCQPVTIKFHARFSAKGKIYRYRIWRAAIMPPFEYGRAWHLPRKLDLNLLKAGAKQFVGCHDFAGFAANRGRPERDTVRNIRYVKVGRRGALYTVEFDGNGFLYKMVRLMVGSLAEIATGKRNLSDLTERLRNLGGAGTRLAAPPEGLYLVRVRY